MGFLRQAVSCEEEHISEFLKLIRARLGGRCRGPGQKGTEQDLPHAIFRPGHLACGRSKGSIPDTDTLTEELDIICVT